MTVRVFCGRNGAHVAAESKRPQGEVILENSRPFAPFASTSSAFLSVSIRVHPWLKYFSLRLRVSAVNLARQPFSLRSLRSLRLLNQWDWRALPSVAAPASQQRWAE
jgi:hypothetical protein